jgi:hypothetical protein
MTPRLTSAMLVSAMIRRVSAAGGNAVVVNRGDDQAGAIILICATRGVTTSLRERILNANGSYEWAPIGPYPIDNNQQIDDYISRRRQRDGDLWVIELDIANAERFAAETTGID